MAFVIVIAGLTSLLMQNKKSNNYFLMNQDAVLILASLQDSVVSGDTVSSLTENDFSCANLTQIHFYSLN